MLKGTTDFNHFILLSVIWILIGGRRGKAQLITFIFSHTF